MLERQLGRGQRRAIQRAHCSGGYELSSGTWYVERELQLRALMCRRLRRQPALKAGTRWRPHRPRLRCRIIMQELSTTDPTGGGVVCSLLRGSHSFHPLIAPPYASLTGSQQPQATEAFKHYSEGAPRAPEAVPAGSCSCAWPWQDKRERMTVDYTCQQRDETETSSFRLRNHLLRQTRCEKIAPGPQRHRRIPGPPHHCRRCCFRWPRRVAHQPRYK